MSYFKFKKFLMFVFYLFCFIFSYFTTGKCHQYIYLLDVVVISASQHCKSRLTNMPFCGMLQLQSFQAEDIKQDYDTGKDGVTMVTFKVDFDRMQSLEEAIKVSCSRDIVFFKR